MLTGIGCATLAVSCLAAYLTASRRWEFHGHDWQDIVEKGGVRKAWDSLHAPTPEGEQRRAARDTRFRHVSAGRKARRERRLANVSRAAKLTMVADARERVAKDFEAAADVQGVAAKRHAEAVGEASGPGHVTETPAGARLLQILAGFNLLVLAGVIALGVGQTVAAFQSAWWAVVPASVIAFLLVHRLLTTLGPLDAHPNVHIASWVLVAALAVLSSPPVALLVITGVAISTWGRKFVRTNASQPLALRLRSPLPWTMAAMYTAVAIGYLAMPPVSFDGVTVQTPSAQFIGGDLSQSSDTVHLIVCTPLADATSTDARLETVSLSRAAKVSANGRAALDSGDRPTLPALVLNLFGLDWPHAIIAPNLHAREATCAGAPPPRLVAGSEDPALGSGVIAGPAPRGRSRRRRGATDRADDRPPDRPARASLPADTGGLGRGSLLAGLGRSRASRHRPRRKSRLPRHACRLPRLQAGHLRAGDRPAKRLPPVPHHGERQRQCAER